MGGRSLLGRKVGSNGNGVRIVFVRSGSFLVWELAVVAGQYERENVEMFESAQDGCLGGKRI